MALASLGAVEVVSMSEKDRRVRDLVKNRPPTWRYGQAVWNYAVEVYGQDLVEPYRCGELDPFNNDGRVEAFLSQLREDFDQRSTGVAQ